MNWQIDNIRINQHALALLRNISLSVTQGNVISIEGENGSGKTVLSYVLGFLSPFLIHHSLSGSILVNNQAPTERLARTFWPDLSYSFQDPDSHYTEIVIRDELQRLGLASKELSNLIERYELGNLLRRSFHKVSYGERQRVLWARDFALGKRYYFVDEVGSYLDSRWQAVLGSDLASLADGGSAVVMFGHPDRALATIAHHRFLLADGYLRVREADNKEHEPIPRQFFSSTVGTPLLEITDLVVQRRGSTAIKLTGRHLISEGDVWFLSGDNGSGKSSLLFAIAGMLPKRQVTGRVIAHTPHDQAIRLVMQNPYSQTIESTIGELLALFTPAPQCLERFPWIETVDKNRDPLSLSFGEQKVLHVLAALYSESPVVLIDELATGLSRVTLMKLVDEIQDAQERGKAIIISGHPGRFTGFETNKVIQL